MEYMRKKLYNETELANYSEEEKDKIFFHIETYALKKINQAYFLFS